MDEEKFAAEIDPIFLDDLKVERERLEGLSKMCDMDIFTEYDEQACEGGERFDVVIRYWTRHREPPIFSNCQVFFCKNNPDHQ